MRRLRRRIDALDRRIVGLLNERAELGREVGRAKAAAGRRAVRDAEREREVLLRVTMANTGPIPQADLLAIYRRLMAATRALEARDRAGARRGCRWQRGRSGLTLGRRVSAAADPAGRADSAGGLAGGWISVGESSPLAAAAASAGSAASRVARLPSSSAGGDRRRAGRCAGCGRGHRWPVRRLRRGTSRRGGGGGGGLGLLVLPPDERGDAAHDEQRSAARSARG